MTVERQNSDGSVSGLRPTDGLEVYRSGAVPGPAGSNTPGWLGGSTLAFNIAGGTDTGGGILSWQNNTGFDMLVTGHQLCVTTVASAACTVSFGSTAVSGTTSASNMISGQDVHSATGRFNGGALSVAVANGSWITGSKASGASAALVGTVFFNYVLVPAGSI